MTAEADFEALEQPVVRTAIVESAARTVNTADRRTGRR
jgi:hypothetical protein